MDPSLYSSKNDRLTLTELIVALEKDYSFLKKNRDVYLLPPDDNGLDTKADSDQSDDEHEEALNQNFLRHGGIEENISIDESKMPYYWKHYAKYPVWILKLGCLFKVFWSVAKTFRHKSMVEESGKHHTGSEYSRNPDIEPEDGSCNMPITRPQKRTAVKFCICGTYGTRIEMAIQTPDDRAVRLAQPMPLHKSTE
ncbi:hypothetical protein ILUMI_09267 [Ignelater luminosus]|uniref:Uncharacterized protein n=1 Tax=Ignelater luminosus TaxID=2038154 RepID=A0A8K0D0A8_IGNLU|nr:hypothetical protein ILUMI_09267 [Ignelater luminosus]